MNLELDFDNPDLDFDSILDQIECTPDDFGIKKEDEEILNEKLDDRYCINCGSDQLGVDTSQTFRICQECGVINKEMFNENPEYSGDGAKDECSRYGCPTNHFYPKASLGTKITSKRYSRLSYIHNQGQMPYRERSLYAVLEKIQGLCKKANINQKIIDNAKILYNKIYQSKHQKGKNKGRNIIMRCVNKKSLEAACVFFGAKFQKESLSNKQVAEIFSLEVKNVNKGCRKILEYIDLRSFKIKNSESVDFVERYSKKLEMDKKYMEFAKDVAINIHKLNIGSTHEPPSVAAACILLTSEIHKLNLSKLTVSKLFDISEVTINKTLNGIKKYEALITDNQVAQKICENYNNNKVEETTDDIVEDRENMKTSKDKEKEKEKEKKKKKDKICVDN
jgi:transcription initiation factor TFIIIB Brf1 subunit/transcription initiation factor TFIIB